MYVKINVQKHFPKHSNNFKTFQNLPTHCKHLQKHFKKLPKHLETYQTYAKPKTNIPKHLRTIKNMTKHLSFKNAERLPRSAPQIMQTKSCLCCFRYLNCFESFVSMFSTCSMFLTSFFFYVFACYNFKSFQFLSFQIISNCNRLKVLQQQNEQITPIEIQ